MAKIVILGNNDGGLYKFRKELIQELTYDNEVYISVPNGDFVNQLVDLGCKFIDTNINRRGTNPIIDLKLIIQYVRIINRIKPHVVLTYTIKPNIYGGLVCRILGIPYIANITGLGSAIENGGLLQRITLFLYKAALKKASCVFFQNKPNRRFFIDKNIVKGKTRLIPGSGVNVEQYNLEEYPEDDGIIKFLFIGRIMKAKGIDELLEAAKRVKRQYEDVQFDLVGGCEEDYAQKLAEFEDLGIINYHGQQKDVRSFIKKANATILPSYHEGTANVLLESASSGRPVLASRVTGCVETFVEGVSGFGFEVKSVDSLVEVITKFINLPYEQKKAMGVAGRKKMEKEFDRSIVVSAYIEEINYAKENLV